MESEGSRRQNAGLTNRNRIEAALTDEKANIFKVQNLHGSHGRRCGGPKRGGQCALPGEVSGFAIKLAGSKGPDEEAGEVSKSHSRSLDPTEGLNRTGGKETCPS